MCSPMLAITAASAVMGYVQQSQMASAQTSAINASVQAQNDATARQYQQTQEQAAQDVSERAKEAMVERARLRVFAGESGLSGASVDRLGNISRMNEGTDLTTIESNRKNTLEQLHLEARGASAKAQSSLNSITQPNLIGSGLQIAGAYVKDKTEAERIKSIGRVKT